MDKHSYAILAVGIPWNQAFHSQMKTSKIFKTEDMSDTPVVVREVEHILLGEKVSSPHPMEVDPKHLNSLEIIFTNKNSNEAIVGMVAHKIGTTHEKKCLHTETIWINSTINRVREILRARNCRAEPKVYLILQEI